MGDLLKIGIIAGGGNAPQELIKACQKAARPFYVIGLTGQADAGLPVDVTLDFGAFGAFKKNCAAQGVKEVVMIGHVRRPSMSELKPDLLGVKALAKIGLNVNGDDSLLTAVADVIQSECGVCVVGAHDIAPEILMPKGVLTKAQPDQQARKDMARALEVARGLGALDVGQAAIVQQGVVLGVEAIEGTDALIKRCGELKRAGGGGVLVKCSKPQQDPRFDLPTLGAQTIQNLADAGLAGVAMEAGASLFLDRKTTVLTADEKGLFISGIGVIESN